MDIRAAAREERAAFADLLATLTPDQWATPTLCAGWDVRDITGHVISFEDFTPRQVVARLVRGRFNPARINAALVAESRARTPDELLELLRAHLEPRGLTTALGCRVAMTDCLVHHQDVCRPLGVRRDIPAERLLVALNLASWAPVLRGFWHGRGVRLVATDVDWSFGRGPEARGSAEAVLMALAGRPVAADLTGPGQPTLARRLGVA